jgi:hypothetical protein
VKLAEGQELWSNLFRRAIERKATQRKAAAPAQMLHCKSWEAVLIRKIGRRPKSPVTLFGPELYFG